MKATDPAVTIIIPSRGIASRATHLWRAIDTVRSQDGVRATPLVVLNGAHRAPEVEGALRAERGVRLIVRDDADLPAAHRAGREAVETEWFGTLDDDDVLLPGALARRVRELESHPDADVLVTNGTVRHDGRDTVHIAGDANVGGAPLRALMTRNWLLPGSWLARSARVDGSLYEGMPRYRECTFLALRFATRYVMRWLQEPTVVYHLGSPLAESRSREYTLGQVQSVRALLALPVPWWMRAHLRREIAAAYHDGADRLWREGALQEAWRLHLRTLATRGGLRYLPFTRHLLTAAWHEAKAPRRSAAQ